MALRQFKGPTEAYVIPPFDVTQFPHAEYGDFTNVPKLTAFIAGQPNRPLPTQPRYWVEALCQIAPPGEGQGGGTGITCGYRRITARGFGINPNTQVTLQEVYRIAQFN